GPTPQDRSVRHYDVVAVAALNELIRQEDDPVPHLEERAPEVSGCLMSVVDACLNSCRPGPIHDNLGVGHPNNGVEVALDEGVDSPPHDLDVLMRHRLLLAHTHP